MPTMRRHFLLGSVATLLGTKATLAQQALPDTMRLILPFAPGNALDAEARQFAEAYRTATGRNCFVENKPGAAATIAASEVARARPDGSVVLWTTGGHLTTAVLMKRLPYDPINDFTPVSPVAAGAGFALVTRTASALSSVDDVIAAARRAPGKLTYASAGIGNTTHVVGALFCKFADVDILHVPYRADFLTDLMAGVTDMMFVSPAVVSPFVKSGKLKLLGITGTQRSARYPNVPSFTESGVRDLGIPAYSFLLAPPKMPAGTLAALHEGVAATLRSPKLEADFDTIGDRAWSLPSDEFKRRLEKELQHLRTVLPPLGIQMDV